MITPPRTAVLASTATGLATLALSRRAAASPLLPVLAAGLAAAHAVDAEHWVRLFVQDACHALFEGRGRPVMEADRRLFRCLPTDIDQNGHMNNAKFIRVLNYARRSLWQRNGVWRHCVSRTPKANMVVTGTTIRYRREIRCFQRFVIVSRLVHWDAQCFYVESRFESLDDATPFVLAISLVKYRVLSQDKLSPLKLLQAVDATVPAESPPAPPDLQAWMSYDRASSTALRPPAA
jgi:acyl-CoA thioesterase FadM